MSQSQLLRSPVMRTKQASWPLGDCRQPKKIVGLQSTLVGIVLTVGFVRGLCRKYACFHPEFSLPRWVCGKNAWHRVLRLRVIVSLPVEHELDGGRSIAIAVLRQVTGFRERCRDFAE